MFINVGDVLESSKISVTKSFTPEKAVSYIDVSCGCMDVKYSRKDNTIKVTYSAGLLDQRTISTKGYEEIHKYLTVRYQDNTVERIDITGRIIKK